jgi:hypothetical protein
VGIEGIEGIEKASWIKNRYGIREKHERASESRKRQKN